MSATKDLDSLRHILEASDATWKHALSEPVGEQWLTNVAERLDAFAAEYERRFGNRPDPLRAFSADPVDVAAFFQIDTVTASIEIMIMVWRVLSGCELERIDFNYVKDRAWHLKVELRTPDGGREAYQGTEPFDFKVLRHFGVSASNGRLLLLGYYPFS
jgi:hypothetical protein